MSKSENDSEVLVMRDENEIIFKSYLRQLLRSLEEINEAVRNKNDEQATELLDSLIERTQRNIED